MKLLVTGATGFLGRSVVAAAVNRNHHVRAIVRPGKNTIPLFWKKNPLVEIVRGDLRDKNSIGPMIEGVDTIVHLAAAKTGDLYEQFEGTVIATENLVNEMVFAGIQRIVLCSTFSVYDCVNKRSWSLIDENSPLVSEPKYRDEYSQTKLVQEYLVREIAAEQGWSCIILRPGVIYGRDNLWTAWLGEQLSDDWWIRTGTFAPIPLTYVENCAEAFIDAVDYKGDDREIIVNVVDDEKPSQRSFLRAVHKISQSKAKVIVLPWFMLRFMARIAWITNTIFFKGNAKLPGLLRPAALHARCKPLRYTNKKLRETLEWSQRFTLKDGLHRSLHGMKGND